jgi:hypothetical protein
MGPSEGDFDDFDDDALWNFVPGNVRDLEQNPIPLSPHREGAAASQDHAPEFRQRRSERSEEIVAAPPSPAQKTMQAAGKQSQECWPHKPLPSNSHAEPLLRPVGMKRRIALRLAAVSVIMVTGFVGFELGYGPRAPLLQSTPRSSQVDQSWLASEDLPTEHVPESAPLPSASPALLSRISTQQLRIDAAKPQRVDTSAKLTVSVTVDNNAPMNFGVELMTYGDVTNPDYAPHLRFW